MTIEELEDYATAQRAAILVLTGLLIRKTSATRHDVDDAFDSAARDIRELGAKNPNSAERYDQIATWVENLVATEDSPVPVTLTVIQGGKDAEATLSIRGIIESEGDESQGECAP
jgi:hypothetical protein